MHWPTIQLLELQDIYALGHYSAYAGAGYLSSGLLFSLCRFISLRSTHWPTIQLLQVQDIYALAHYSAYAGAGYLHTGPLISSRSTHWPTIQLLQVQDIYALAYFCRCRIFSLTITHYSAFDGTEM